MNRWSVARGALGVARTTLRAPRPRSPSPVPRHGAPQGRRNVDDGHPRTQGVPISLRLFQRHSTLPAGALSLRKSKQSGGIAPADHVLDQFAGVKDRQFKERRSSIVEGHARPKHQPAGPEIRQ